LPGASPIFDLRGFATCGQHPYQAALGGSIPCLASLMGALRQGIGGASGLAMSRKNPHKRDVTDRAIVEFFGGG
jgi:hypothetical protein